ncbi:unnamed protein product, partial [Rotaria sp. Silwood2]
MEPAAILNVIDQVVMVIQQTVTDVKANSNQCKRLGNRIDNITLALKSMNTQDLEKPELRKILNNYRTCIEKCLEFITQFKDETSWFLKIFENQNYKKQFERLNLQLTRCATDFNLGIDLKQIFDSKVDENDQKMDLNVIQCKLDDMALLMAQRQNEQYHYYKGIEQNINQRLNSFKHHLQQNIIRKSDVSREQKIAEEEHAFLHIPYYDLIQEKIIGQGGFADVYHGRWLSQDHEVAIKMIRIHYLDEKVKGDLMKEISIMYRIHYDHILGIFGACMEPEKYALIVEYMSLGSLHDVLKNKTLQLTWPDRWLIAGQMTKGINYLHTLPKPIIHRDIKSLNILMTNSLNGFLVKVADFGLAKIRHETSRQSSHNPSVGTLPWKAPELLKMGKHTEASDVYALGVVLWELGTGYEPYEEADDSTISAFVLRGDRLDIPTNIPSSFAELVSKAWAHEPQKRPSCQQLLSLMRQVSFELDVTKKSEATGMTDTMKTEAITKQVDETIEKCEVTTEKIEVSKEKIVTVDGKLEAASEKVDKVELKVTVVTEKVEAAESIVAVSTEKVETTSVDVRTVTKTADTVVTKTPSSQQYSSSPMKSNETSSAI